MVPDDGIGIVQEGESYAPGVDEFRNAYLDALARHAAAARELRRATKLVKRYEDEIVEARSEKQSTSTIEEILFNLPPALSARAAAKGLADQEKLAVDAAWEIYGSHEDA